MQVALAVRVWVPCTVTDAVEGLPATERSAGTGAVEIVSAAVPFTIAVPRLAWTVSVESPAKPLAVKTMEGPEPAPTQPSVLLTLQE